MNPIIIYNGYVRDNKISVDRNTKLPIQNVNDGNVYTKWNSDDYSGYTIAINFEANREVDTILLSGHNLGSKSAEVEVRKEGASNEIISEIIYNDNPFFYKSSQITSSDKFEIDFDSDHYKQEIGFLYLGKSIEFPHPPDAPLISFSEGISPKSETLQSGNLLSTEKRFNPVSISHSFSDIPKQWIEDSYIPFWNNWAKLGQPFVYAWDLENNPEDVFIVRFSIEHIHVLPLNNLNYIENLLLNMVGSR